MPSERDPRKDPKPGDMLRNHGRTRTVREVCRNGDIGWSGDPPASSRKKRIGNVIGAKGWQSWAKDAEVIHASD